MTHDIRPPAPSPTPLFPHRHPLEEAANRFFGALEEAGSLLPMPQESLPLAQAQGRVTARPIWAEASSPHYDAAAMDGVAVRATDTAGATETAPVTLQLDSQAVWVDTGDPMPTGFDAVVMIEHLHRLDDGAVRVMAPVAPWQHVRPLGEDIVATELVLAREPPGRPGGPGGLRRRRGLTHLPVRQLPRVAIIPTGNELVPVGSPTRPGDIIEYNSLMLAGMVHDWGGRATVFPPTPDDFAAISGAARQALADSDLVIINAGSSAGSEDYTAAVVEGLGKLLVHGIAIRPGHTVVLGVAPASGAKTGKTVPPRWHSRYSHHRPARLPGIRRADRRVAGQALVASQVGATSPGEAPPGVRQGHPQGGVAPGRG